MTVIDRFFQLISIESTADESSETCPSSPGQLLVAQEAVAQMLAMGIADARVDANGYVTGTIPANCDRNLPATGLVAHMDTSPDAPGKDIRARLTELYEGGDIVLNEELGLVLSPSDYPSLNNHIGKHLIVTDGTTLLSSDDKAGVAEILAAAEILLHTDRPHGKICIGFTPDEEIGRGTDHFDIPGFGAEFAYTVDGGALGEIEYENFNAASASVVIHGRSIHPGSGKGKMINASLVAIELNSLLPALETPFYTEGYEGFFHLTDICGKCERAELNYIIRDHDRVLFERRKQIMETAVGQINEKYGAGTADLAMKDTYYNMKEKIEPFFFLIDNAKAAFEKNGVTPRIIPIRGGTDGVRLSYDGLPCPNLCTGGENFHSRFEYCVAEDMETMVKILVDLLTVQ